MERKAYIAKIRKNRHAVGHIEWVVFAENALEANSYVQAAALQEWYGKAVILSVKEA